LRLLSRSARSAPGLLAEHWLSSARGNAPRRHAGGTPARRPDGL